MDLRSNARVLYISSVDVSLGNGPGVNESGFISALHSAIGERAHFILPTPSRGEISIPADRCTFVRSHGGHRVVLHPLHLVDQYRRAKQLSASRFDLVCVRLDVLPAALYSSLLRSPVPYAIKTLGQGPLNVLRDRGGPVGSILAPLNRRMFSRLVQGSLVADACSPSMARLMADRLGVSHDKIVWVDNAVDVDRFSPEPADAVRRRLGLTTFGRIVGYIGSRPWERGGLAIVDAAPALLDLFPDLGVLIVGDGPRLGDLRRRAHDLGVVDHCIFVGAVPPGEVPAYVNALDVGVSINSRDDRFHAAELKVRQYIACGKPVVVTPGGNSFVEETGLGRVISTATQALVLDSLSSLLRRERGEAEAFSRRAREYAIRELSYGRAVEKRFDIWNERYQRAS